MGVIQEKYQTIFPDTEEEPGPWVGPESARAGRKGVSKGNRLPPGETIHQAVADIRTQDSSMAGQTDLSEDTNSESLKCGYTKLEMSPTEDAYTREHNDAFYDDVGGYVERNNVLDRM